MAFDTNTEIGIKIRRREGEQLAVVRWPTDEEWAERMKGWRITIHRLGRGVSETDVESGAADLALYQKIRTPDSPDLAPEEASKVIGDIGRCDIDDVLLGMDTATVEMTVYGKQTVKHILRIPTTAEVTQFKRGSSRVMDMPHNRQQIRTNLLAGAKLWEACHESHEGYVNGVPVMHQDAAIRAVLDKCETAAEAGKDEDF